jgi:hypothetical protein
LLFFHTFFSPTYYWATPPFFWVPWFPSELADFFCRMSPYQIYKYEIITQPRLYQGGEES